MIELVLDCRDPDGLARFWGAALSYEVVDSSGSYRSLEPIDGDDPGPALVLQAVHEPKVGKNRLHLDVVTSGSMEAEVARLVEAGAELVEVRQDPSSFDNPDTWTVMRDPEGNEFCVTSTSTLTGLD